MHKAVYTVNLFGTIRGEEARLVRQQDVTFRSDFSVDSFHRSYQFSIYGSKTQTTLHSGKPEKVVTIACQCIDTTCNSSLTEIQKRAFRYDVAKVLQK